MNIAFFGSSLVSAYWNGAATYYRGLLSALARLGHRISFYEPDAFERQAHRDIPDPSWARVVVYPGDDERAALAALDDARGADLVVKASGVGVYDELLERAVLSLRSPRCLVAFWDVDAPATLERMIHDPADAFRALVPQYDMIFTYGGGEPVTSAYRALGAQACAPIYNALDPSTHHPVARQPRFEVDLALCANRLPDREARVHEFLLEPARALPERRFLLAGSGWSQADLPRNVGHIGHLYTRDHNAFNCSPLAVLNVTRDSMTRFGFSPATRVFEVAGAGACLISDFWEGMALFLEPGREVVLVESGADLIRELSGLSPQRAASVGAAARRRVLAAHTYDHRAREVERVLDVGARGRAAARWVDRAREVQP
jgi:spore maturation protein CgeB